MDSDTIKKFPNKDCGVDEKMFPCMGKCYRKNDAASMAAYENICAYCEVSASLPYGASLKVVIIFECGRFGYGKRVTE